MGITNVTKYCCDHCGTEVYVELDSTPLDWWCLILRKGEDDPVTTKSWAHNNDCANALISLNV